MIGQAIVGHAVVRQAIVGQDAAPSVALSLAGLAANVSRRELR